MNVVSYECLAALLNSGRVGSRLAVMGVPEAHLHNCTVSVSPDLRGVFGCPTVAVGDLIESDVEL